MNRVSLLAVRFKGGRALHSSVRSSNTSFPWAASASPCCWTCSCFLQGWRSPDLVCDNYCACFPLSCLCSPSLRSFSCPCNLSCTFSRLSETNFHFLSQVETSPRKELLLSSHDTDDLFLCSDLWKCKFLTKVSVYFALQSSLLPCPRQCWGEYFWVPARSLSAGAKGLWAVLNRAGGSHRETHLRHSTTRQAQTCPEKQLAQTFWRRKKGSVGMLELLI